MELVYPKIKYEAYSKMSPQDRSPGMDQMRDDDSHRGSDNDSMTSMSLSPPSGTETGPDETSNNDEAPPSRSRSPLSMSSWTEISCKDDGTSSTDANSPADDASELGSDNIVHRSPPSVANDEGGHISDDVSCLDLSVNGSVTGSQVEDGISDCPWEEEAGNSDREETICKSDDDFEGISSTSAESISTESEEEDDESAKTFLDNVSDTVSWLLVYCQNGLSHFREVTMAKLGEGYRSGISSLRNPSRMARMAIIFIVVISGCTSLLVLMRAAGLLEGNVGGLTSWYIPSQIPDETRTSVYAAATPSHVGAGFASQNLDAQLSLPTSSSSPFETRLQSCSSDERASASGDIFHVYVIGDGHILIKSPASYDSVSPPTFKDVTLTRHTDIIPYEISMLFDGVYSLRLSRQNSWGHMNITITANPRQVPSGKLFPMSRTITDKYVTEVHFPDSVLTFAERQWGHVLSLWPTNELFDRRSVNAIWEYPDVGGFISRQFEKSAGKKFTDTDFSKKVHQLSQKFREKTRSSIPTGFLQRFSAFQKALSAQARFVCSKLFVLTSKSRHVFAKASQFMHKQHAKYFPKLARFFQYSKKESSNLGAWVSKTTSRMSRSILRCKEVVTAQQRAKKLLVKIGAKTEAPPPPMPKRIGNAIMNGVTRVLRQ